MRLEKVQMLPRSLHAVTPDAIDFYAARLANRRRALGVVKAVTRVSRREAVLAKGVRADIAKPVRAGVFEGAAVKIHDRSRCTACRLDGKARRAALKRNALKQNGW